jgi:hypothetical protein
MMLSLSYRYAKNDYDDDDNAQDRYRALCLGALSLPIRDQETCPSASIPGKSRGFRLQCRA